MEEGSLYFLDQLGDSWRLATLSLSSLQWEPIELSLEG